MESNLAAGEHLCRVLFCRFSFSDHCVTAALDMTGLFTEYKLTDVTQMRNSLRKKFKVKHNNNIIRTDDQYDILTNDTSDHAWVAT
jgi:hypothetical protein